jgi:hypothetical protein
MRYLVGCEDANRDSQRRIVFEIENLSILRTTIGLGFIPIHCLYDRVFPSISTHHFIDKLSSEDGRTYP